MLLILLLITCHTYHTTSTHHFPDKKVGYNGGKSISKQTLMKAMNSGANTKS